MYHNFDPHAEIAWLERYNAIHVKWKQLHMPTERFQQICAKAASTAVQYKAKIWIADQYEREGIFSQEQQRAITGNLQAITLHLGVKSVLRILPKTMRENSSSIKRLTQKIRPQDELLTRSFTTLEECLEWIAQRGEEAF